jgi:MoxR-like ATPase
MGKYHETEFYRAFTKGGLFMLDEIDASIPETLVILNAAIANRYFDFPHVGRVKAHSDFRIIAAGNTYGTGASYQYVGRNQLDGASLNRFAIVEINYDKKIENSISSDSELVAFIRNFRKAVEKNGINHIVSYRELGRLDKMIRVGMEITKALKSCLIKNLKQDELKIIINSLPDRENKYKGDLQKCVE